MKPPAGSETLFGIRRRAPFLRRRHRCFNCRVKYRQSGRSICECGAPRYCHVAKSRRHSRLIAWLICWKRPINARTAWLAAAGNGEYRCPCGRCDLPVLPPRNAS